jgi:hypothetical protein
VSRPATRGGSRELTLRSASRIVIENIACERQFGQLVQIAT